MTNQDAPARPHDAPSTHRFVPVAEAARILGLSATTIRRRIDAGELEAERVVRPQGTAFLVKVPADAPPRAEEAPGTHQDAPGTLQQEPAGTTSLAAVLAPLVAQLAAAGETIERQADQLVHAAEERGRLTAELEAERAARGELQGRHEEIVAYARRLTIAVAVIMLGVVLATVAAVLAPAWVR